MNQILRIGPWGYNMTLNNFYVVVRETAKTAIVRDIGSKVVESSNGFSGKESPDVSVQNVNFKEYRVLKIQNPDGSIKYRGSCEMHRTFDLQRVEAGDSFYFNHLD